MPCRLHQINEELLLRRAMTDLPLAATSVTTARLSAVRLPTNEFLPVATLASTVHPPAATMATAGCLPAAIPVLTVHLPVESLAI